MIYISSSAVKCDKINDAVKNLADAGFKNIELSGGTEFYKGYSDDLMNLKNEYDLNYLLHNYFPPPRNHFVLNIASLNDAVYYKSMDHIKKAIDLSVYFEADKYAFHSGFLLDISLNEIGKIITENIFFDYKKSLDRFISSVNELIAYANNEVQLYIENNVISGANFESFNKINPFFFTNADDYFEISKNSDVKPLIDLAHLYVSCNTLGKSFESEFDKLFSETDYLHISSNNGKADTNEYLSENHKITETLKQYNLKDKTITLEIYDEIHNIKKSFKLIEDIIYAKKS